MANVNAMQRPTLLKEPDWSTMTTEQIVAFGDAATRKAASPPARLITGRRIAVPRFDGKR